MISVPQLKRQIAEGLTSPNPILKLDVDAILQYREYSDEVSPDSFVRWFPDLDPITFEYLDPNRDFMFSHQGIKIFKTRYLMLKEPIQYGWLRIAKLFSRSFDELVIMYTLLSCGFMTPSSILAAADHAVKPARPGEACRLLLSHPDYGQQFIKQMEHICTIVNLGVGIGLGAETVPRVGKTEPGKIRNGFRQVAERLNACNTLSLHERRPKVAMYIYVHNDTVFDAFDLKSTSKGALENVFFGLMIPDYFMECVRNDLNWYLFDGQIIGDDLSNVIGKEYEKLYKKYVSKKLYNRKIPARELMRKIIESILQNGSPYIVWSDTVNRFSNHEAPVKTLNLCAEITNTSSHTQSSSCVLMTINIAMCYAFPTELGWLMKTFKPSYANTRFPELCAYSEFISSYATIALNNVLGDAEYREIGISPTGMFDAGIMSVPNAQPSDIAELCRDVSEAIYLGAVKSSSAYYNETGLVCKNYTNSHFELGKFQFHLRNVTPQFDWNFISRYSLRTRRLANSMLTCQAPTSTTSMLTGVTESVTYPMSQNVTRECESGRFLTTSYGFLHNLINNVPTNIQLPAKLKDQVEMYSVSAPYIDHSQSTMFSGNFNLQKLFDLIVDTFTKKLKTGIYYTLNLQNNSTLPVIRSSTCDTCTM